GFGVVGVADVDTHWHAHELTAEVILQSGTRDLFAVEQIFRSDESNHGIDQQRLEAPRDRIGARLECLLIYPVMCICRERAALAGFEIHYVIADRAPPERQRGLACLIEQREADPEACIGRSRAGN